MKVLHVFDIFTSGANGTVSLLRQLTGAQSQRGYQVTICTSDYKHISNVNDKSENVSVKRFHSCLNVAGLHITLGLLWRENLICFFDIIHLHCFRSFQNIVVHRFAKKYGIPYVVDAHGSLPRGRGFKRLLHALYDILWGFNILGDAKYVIAETNFGVSEYKCLGIPEDKIILIAPSMNIKEFVDLPTYGTFRMKYKVWSDAEMIMYLGRINKIKGLDFLVCSFSELEKRRSNIMLVIVGQDDGYKQHLVELISELNIKSVLFTGFLTGKEKLSAFVDANVVVQTSNYEQGAWMPLEAVLCNTPIVVNGDTGAGEDVRKLDAGYVYKSGDISDFVSKVEFVLDNHLEVEAKTEKARERIKDVLSLEQGVLRYEILYENAIRESSSNVTSEIKSVI